MSSNAPSIAEYQRRLLFSLLRGAVRLAARFRMPLRAFEDLCRLAYYEEFRRRGEASQAEVAQVFQKSLRTVGVLEKALRSDFFAPEYEVELMRRVEAAFSASPRELDSVAESLGEPLAQVESLVESLAAAGRVVRQEAGWVLDHRYVSLVGPDFKTRVDGLNHQLDIVAGAVGARFLSPQRPALARSLTFMARPIDIESFGTELMGALRTQSGAAEDAAVAKGNYESYGLTVAVAPVETS